MFQSRIFSWGLGLMRIWLFISKLSVDLVVRWFERLGSVVVWFKTVPLFVPFNSIRFCLETVRSKISPQCCSWVSSWLLDDDKTSSFSALYEVSKAFRAVLEVSPPPWVTSQVLDKVRKWNWKSFQIFIKKVNIPSCWKDFSNEIFSLNENLWLYLCNVTQSKTFNPNNPWNLNPS